MEEITKCVHLRYFKRKVPYKPDFLHISMAAKYNLDSTERQMKLGSPSNETILQQLRSGIACFEIAASPVASLSGQCGGSTRFLTSSAAASPGFFARIGNPVVGSPAMKKVERYSVRKVTGDGRCLFRALVKGMAINKGMRLGPREERESADELRMAVKEVICDNDKERFQFEEALVAITVEESLKRYCQRIGRPDFWGGEPELLVLSKLCCQPIVVYIPEHEHGGRGAGFIPIQEYGSEFHKGSEQGKQKAVRLLYTGRNHYDLLV
ncbi:OVARIAN TUMOR DOMAIN-containing deubiquitinating enzyme 3 isoform X2 [Salvia splendens]|uniref:OVARIAN TUMOR DOMAIN-containing deubiquitinating enzyme 3 isoform X2 n=1 Tax=Salvia splendens TaxID=180675 RepID=UPI001C2700A3|nr:OVARIAN TUMOR DOMAIN-containing deubiquitinating enzyme 3 isoform X2 [Salvia splendens]